MKIKTVVGLIVALLGLGALASVSHAGQAPIDWHNQIRLAANEVTAEQVRTQQQTREQKRLRLDHAGKSAQERKPGRFEKRYRSESAGMSYSGDRGQRPSGNPGFGGQRGGGNMGGGRR